VRQSRNLGQAFELTKNLLHVVRDQPLEAIGLAWFPAFTTEGTSLSGSKA